ncbi:MAG TPA: hypothetical protein VGI61_14015, partial [Parafilimonas sp.]
MLNSIIVSKIYSQQNIYSNIPTLKELSGIWVNADTISMEPSLRNFKAQALLNRDMSSVSWVAAAPFSGGYHTVALHVNGETPRAQLFRWFPWQALRKTSLPGYDINSNVRMLPDSNLIMWQIEISNTTKAVKHFNVQQDLIGFISCYDKDVWTWNYPYPTLQGKTNTRTNEIVNVRWNIGLKPQDFQNISYDNLTPKVTSWPSDSEILASNKYSAQQKNNLLIIADKESECFSAFDIIDVPDKIIVQNSGGTAYWSFDLKPGDSRVIRFMLSYDKSKENLVSFLKNKETKFNTLFNGVEETWNNRWQKLFRPGELLSASFPVLKTNDAAVKKVYYTGPLTMLYLLNTNLPAHKRVHLTGSPTWGGTVVFFWDASEWSTLYAVADPVILKEQIKSWISLDINKYYGKDNYTGKGVGNGYVANYWALFQLIRSYITVTKDYAFLNEDINGKKLIDYLYEYSYNWKNLSLYGKPGCTDDIYKLADFGDDPWNLLECVPTYIHIVPSFNAGYVWMMRETASFYNYLKNTATANTISADADAMAARVLKLYAGNGVWNSLYPYNKNVEVRHVLDFQYMGRYMSRDLSQPMRNDINKFVNDELLTNTWMRAQSLKDSAASYSDRPDHGPLGAYDGWPAATMDAFTQMGFADQAFAFYKRVEPVTYE